MGPLTTGDDVVLLSTGEKGWIIGWRGDRPLVQFGNDIVEIDQDAVRNVPRTPRAPRRR